MKTAQDLVAFSQANLAAFANAGRILAEGMQDLSRQAMEIGQARLAGGIEHLKSLSGVTSIGRAVELQTQAVRATVASSLADTSRFTEATIKLVENVAGPLTTRADAALQVFARAA